MNAKHLLMATVRELDKHGIQPGDFFVDEKSALACSDFWKLESKGNDLDKLDVYLHPAVQKKMKFRLPELRITNLQIYTADDRVETYNLLSGYSGKVWWGFLAMPIFILKRNEYQSAYRRLLEIAGSKKSMAGIIPQINKKLKLLETI